jgi:crotonobetainyl-CoA:carnitine CoA-transferase CaiB-like acyl-CoA transferase
MSTLIGEAFVAASLRGQELKHHGNRDEKAFAQGVYRVAGDDQWIAVTLRTEGQWNDLAHHFGLEADLAGLEEAARQEEVDRRLAAWLADKDPQWVLEALAARAIPAGRVLNTVDIHNDPHLEARGFWVELPHPRMQPWKQPRSAWQFREAPVAPRRHAPLFGEHNDEILRGLLGLGDAEIAELEAAGVIASAPVNPGVG